MKIRTIITLLCSLVVMFTPLTSQGVAVSNSYYFIENKVDNAYFISPQATDPRFSGSNVYSKYAGTTQLSLGYMGYSGVITLNQYADIWLENSPINNPFIGNRCMRTIAPCPSTGYLPAEFIGKDGIYKIKMFTHAAEAGYVRGVFSDAAYEYFKSLPVNSTEVYTYKYCYTDKDYNPAIGETCTSKGGTNGNDVFTMSKKGHLVLKSTSALQEIFIDSQGNPSIGLGSGLCTVGTVASVSGAVCKLVAYEAAGTMLSPMYIQLKTNNAALGFTPAATEIKISPDGTTNWANYSVATLASQIVKSGNDGIYVFFSKTFFKKLIDTGTNLNMGADFFSFYFTNTVAPQSGFYEFSPSTTIMLKPRDYGISIVSKDQNMNPSKTGKVGGTEQPIEFEYIVTTSGPRQANEITAQVKQDGSPTVKNGKNYCTFLSTDQRIKVPFSAYLSYTDQTGTTVRNRNSCNDPAISLNSARWQESPWAAPAQNDGSFYRTDLKLSIPMNEPESQYTVDGHAWDGVVGASGNIEVKAIWTGADIK